MNHQAIRNLYPQVVVIQDGIGCFDINNESVEIDAALVDAETARLAAERAATEYKRQRAPEYPSLQDLADALYWQSKGNSEPMINYIAACETVKTKYPKGE